MTCPPLARRHMTWSVIRINPANDNPPTVLASGLLDRDAAVIELRNQVRSFLNGEYDNRRWEARWQPNRDQVFYRKLNGRRVRIFRMRDDG